MCAAFPIVEAGAVTVLGKGEDKVVMAEAENSDKGAVRGESDGSDNICLWRMLERGRGGWQAQRT